MAGEFKPIHNYEFIEWREYKITYREYNFVEIESILREPAIFIEKLVSNETALCVIEKEENKSYCRFPYFAEDEYPKKGSVYNEAKKKINISGMVFDSFKFSAMLKMYELEETEFYFVAIGTIFKNNTECIKTTFTGRATFYSATFTGRANFRKTMFIREVDFTSAKFNSLILNGCEIHNKFNLENIKSLEVLSILEFTNYGYLNIRWDQQNIDGKKTNLAGCIRNYYILNEKKPDYREIKEQLRFLKENFRKNGRYDEEDKAYFEFKKAERIEELFGDNDKLKWDEKKSIFTKFVWLYRTKKPFSHIGNWLLEKVGGYGTKPWKVMVNMVIVVFVFFIIFGGLSFIQDWKDSAYGEAANCSAQRERNILVGIEYEAKDQNDLELVVRLPENFWEEYESSAAQEDSLINIPLSIPREVLTYKAELMQKKVEQFQITASLRDSLEHFRNNTKERITFGQRIGNAAYLSGITFVTVGFGDVCPPPYGKGFAVAEGFLGLFLMSYLTIAFSRKVLR